MPTGSISSSKDAVGVAVVNYRVPVCESRQDVLQNCARIAKMIEGAKRGYPGLDLIIFPEVRQHAAPQQLSSSSILR
jgi:amidase